MNVSENSNKNLSSYVIYELKKYNITNWNKKLIYIIEFHVFKDVEMKKKT